MPRVAPILAVALSIACSSAATPSDGDARSGDHATPDAGGGDSTPPDAGPCTTSLDQVPGGYGDCMATYAETIDAANAIACSYVTVSSGACGGLEAIRFDYVTHLGLCIYSGTGAAPLVGVEDQSDVNEFCGGTAYQIRGGNVPDACAPDALMNRLSPVSCSAADAATDAPADAGAD